MVVSHESGGIQPSLFAKLLLLASNPVPGQLFQSVSLPVDARLSEKIRAKIWKDEYVDFGSLLANPVLVDQYQITINNSDSGLTPSLCLEPLARHKKVTTTETWLSSFHVFVGAYTKQFPHEAPALMKYGEIIQDLAGRGHNWKFYDDNFRFSEAGTPCRSSVGLNPW